MALKFNRTRDHWFKSGQILIEMTTLGSDSSGHKLESNLSPVYRGVRFLHTLNWSLGSFLRVRGNLFYKWHLLKRDWNHWLDDHPNNMTLISRTFLFTKSPNQRGIEYLFQSLDNLLVWRNALMEKSSKVVACH